MQPERIIGIGDLHGCYELFRKLIEENIRPRKDKDLLICLGDYIDRGSESALLIEYMRDLMDEYGNGFIRLMGNHEAMALSYFLCSDAQESRRQWDIWMGNGGKATIESLKEEGLDLSDLKTFLNGLKFFHETDSHIFAHGGIPPGKTLKTVNNEELLSNRDFGYHGKPLVVGHIIHREVTFYPCVTAVDTGAFQYGRLSAFDVVNREIYSAER